MVQINGFQNPGLKFASPAGGLVGFQRQGMDQRKKSSGAPSGVMAVLNAADKNAGMLLSNGDLRGTKTGAAAEWGTARATVGKAAGKFYCEALNVAASGTGASSVAFGLAPASYVFSAGAPGFDAAGLSLGLITNSGSGVFSSGGLLMSITNDWGAGGGGAVAGMAVDLDARLVWFRVSGGVWNAGGTANPATGLGGLALPAGVAGVIFPALAAANNALPDTVQANFGQSAYSVAAPAGFNNWVS